MSAYSLPFEDERGRKLMPTYTQLELNLWGDLKSALNQPDVANFSQLWQDLDRAIAPLENNQQLHVAAEAISQIVA